MDFSLTPSAHSYEPTASSPRPSLTNLSQSIVEASPLPHTPPHTPTASVRLRPRREGPSTATRASRHLSERAPHSPHTPIAPSPRCGGTRGGSGLRAGVHRLPRTSQSRHDGTGVGAYRIYTRGPCQYLWPLGFLRVVILPASVTTPRKIVEGFQGVTPPGCWGSVPRIRKERMSHLVHILHPLPPFV